MALKCRAPRALSGGGTAVVRALWPSARGSLLAIQGEHLNLTCAACALHQVAGLRVFFQVDLGCGERFVGQTSREAGRKGGKLNEETSAEPRYLKETLLCGFRGRGAEC